MLIFEERFYGEVGGNLKRLNGGNQNSCWINIKLYNIKKGEGLYTILQINIKVLFFVISCSIILV